MTSFSHRFFSVSILSLLLSSWSACPVLAQSAETKDKDFIVGPEDVMEVQVWDKKDLN